MLALASVLVTLLFAGAASAQRSATMPLSRWLDLSHQVETLRQNVGEVPAVVVSEAIYSGESDGRNLLLTLRLKAMVEEKGGREPVLIPVAPHGVIVREARVINPGGAASTGIGLRAVDGMQVWETTARGAVEIELKIVVPPTGPRGSFEYVFATVQAVRTTIRCRFPDDNLVPQVEGASNETVTPRGDGVELYAVLKSTNQIRITGFHGFAEESDQDAKVYVDGQHLLSIEEDRAELFSVLRLHILYAKKRRFLIELPKGYELIRADGEGAFRSVVEQRDGVPVLVGETASAMKDRYEISLRLRRTLKGDLKSVPVPVPRLLGAERDTGAVAVELPGRLTFEGHTGETLRPIDPRELPQSLVESSVSPIIAAFRYAEDKGVSTLKLRRVPAYAVAAGGIDRLEATTVITDDGRQMTDLRFTMRNLLRRHLAVRLPKGAKVESAFLDGKPVKPSTVDDKVLLPLARSARVNNRLKKIQVQLVYVESAPAFGLGGVERLTLPTVDVPISTVKWTTYVPRRHRTAGTFDRQSSYVRSARFERAQPTRGGAGRSGSAYNFSPSPISDTNSIDQGMLRLLTGDNTGNQAGYQPSQAIQIAGQGAMPVRVNIPTQGRAHRLRRDWVREGEVVSATLYHAQVPVVIATKWLALLLLASCFFFALGARRRRVLLGVAVALAAGVSLAFGPALAVLSALMGCAVFALRALAGKHLLTSSKELGQFQFAALRERALARWETERTAFTERKEKNVVLAVVVVLAKVAWKGALLTSLLWLTLIALGLGAALLALLSNPL